MVPATIFQRLSSLGSGGGVNAGTIPSRQLSAKNLPNAPLSVWPCFTPTSTRLTVTTVTPVIGKFSYRWIALGSSAESGSWHFGRDQLSAGNRSEIPSRKIIPIAQLYTAPVHAIT